MSLAFVGLIAVSLLELLLWFPFIWSLRKAISVLLALAIVTVTVIFLSLELHPWAIFIAILSLYRVINLARIVKGRMHADYLFHATRKTSLWLIGIQISTLFIAWAIGQVQISTMTWWYTVAIVQLVGILILTSSALRHLRTTRPPHITTELSESELPTLSVAIPARNETDDLQACLQSLIASGYPKLEILVLDDCSQNKRTPEIIREFAHDGVRFIAGNPSPEQWLAKNYAYSQLAEQSNGELILFCGVDARFEPDSLLELVKVMLHKKKNMVSIMPANATPQDLKPSSLLLQPSRYAWELVPPRRLLERPPVLSTCWIISRQALESAGGFDAVRRKCIPESYLARAAAKSGDGYSFLQSESAIGISSNKSFDEQLSTAIRTRYPQLHRRPELTAIISVTEIFLLVWPLVLLITSLFSQEWVLAILAVITYLLSSFVYVKIVNLTYRRFIIHGLWILPIAVLYDIGVLNYSMWQYEFREVLWKGRNVCIPVMRVIPELPKTV